MLNTNIYKSGDVNTSLNINAITGTLVKNYKDSFFIRFHLKSKFAESIFDEENPHIKKGYKGFERKSIVILQCMVCGDMEVLCEVMWKEDFEKLFQKGEQNDDNR